MTENKSSTGTSRFFSAVQISAEDISDAWSADGHPNLSDAALELEEFEIREIAQKVGDVLMETNNLREMLREASLGAITSREQKETDKEEQP